MWSMCNKVLEKSILKQQHKIKQTYKMLIVLLLMKCRSLNITLMKHGIELVPFAVSSSCKRIIRYGRATDASQTNLFTPNHNGYAY